MISGEWKLIRLSSLNIGRKIEDDLLPLQIDESLQLEGLSEIADRILCRY